MYILDFRFSFCFFVNCENEIDHMKSFKNKKMYKDSCMCYFHILSNFAENCYVKSSSHKALRCALFMEQNLRFGQIWVSCAV